MKIFRENWHQINLDPAFFSAPYKYSTTVDLRRSLKFVNGHRQRINHSRLDITETNWFNQLIAIANFSFFSVRDFNVTVLLHCELYTGFLQRINQFSSSVKFANGYYENQLTDSKRWWYFYICQKFTYDRWITYLWLFVDFRATITSNFTGYRNTQNRQIYRTM